MSNPLGKVIAKPLGRRLAIGDIHGCAKTFEALLDRINLQKEDQLFLLGDYINRGTDSRRVLDKIISLSKEYEVYPLLGNHDLMLLNYYREKSDPLKKELQELNTGELLDLDPSAAHEYETFLASLYHYYISKDMILVHAGFNFNLSNPFLGTDDMLSIREFYYDSAKAQNKTIVHGHNPKRLTEIEESLKRRSKILPLDNGCVFLHKEEGMGYLLCVDLDKLELIRQLNCD